MMVKPKKEADMLKKILLIAILVLTAMALIPRESMAWNSIDLAKWGYGTYTGTFKLVGGGPDKPGNYAIFKGVYYPVDVYLWQFNPTDKDVRVGIGGLKGLETITTEDNFKVDENGNFLVDQILLSRVPEFAEAICDPNYLNGEYSDLYDYYYGNPPPFCPSNPGDPSAYDVCENPTNADCAVAVAEFMKFWGLTEKDLRNKNWIAYEVLIKTVELSGTVYSKCDKSTDIDSCSKATEDAIFTCTTDEDPRYWPGEDGEVIFFCEEIVP
jgi:hypothetical protein